MNNLKTKTIYVKCFVFKKNTQNLPDVLILVFNQNFLLSVCPTPQHLQVIATFQRWSQEKT